MNLIFNAKTEGVTNTNSLYTSIQNIQGGGGEGGGWGHHDKPGYLMLSPSWLCDTYNP